MRQPARPWAQWRLLAAATALLAAGACRSSGADQGPGAETIGQPPAPTGGDPGRVTLHRLNRAEYNNTVRDLLGTSQRPANEFPSDDRGYGFDNIADVLSLSPLQLEMYQRAAEALIAEALRADIVSATSRYEAETVGSTVGVAYANAWWNLYANGDVAVDVKIPAPGSYRVSARAWAQQAGPEPARLILKIGTQSKTFDITAASETMPQVVENTVTLPAGTVALAAEFPNDFYMPAMNADRNLFVDYLEIQGPLDGVTKNPQRARLVVCDLAGGGEACARDIIRGFARRAWRRPVTDDEVARLLVPARVALAEGDGWESGVALALQAVLVSPRFLFRVEIDTSPASPTPHPLTAHEVAARLSYFLWSSMPDEALFAAADAGGLKDPAAVRAQVARMLADPKAAAFIDNFAGQWLHTRKLDDHEPDYQAFPSYDKVLRDDLREETHAMFRDVLRGDLGLDRLLVSSETYLTDRLARHYGLPAPGSTEPRRASVAGTARGGLLTHGSFLTVTSYPTRTSPVVRGRWVLENLLCTPPPPPPGVEGLTAERMPTGTLRQRMEAHRANPTCAACHAPMDPIGFGLEHYDGVGAYRTQDAGGFPIDASGTMPDGKSFSGARQLADIIVADPRFARCAAEKIYVYALGRGPDRPDLPVLEGIGTTFASGGYKLQGLIEQVVASRPFVMRRGEPATAGGMP